MRHDLFQARKCIHITLKKEVHSGFRAKMFERGMSMQEVVEEFARLVASDDSRANKLLDEYARRRLLETIERAKKPREPERIGELDNNSLYDLIQLEEENNEAT